MKLTWAILITLSIHFFTLFMCGAKSVVYKRSNFSQKLGQSRIKTVLSTYKPPVKIEKVTKKSKKLKSKKVKEVSKKLNARSDVTKAVSTSGKKSKLASYLTKVRSVIVKNKYKNRVAKKFNLKGIVKVAFEIDKNSKISGVKLIKSSSVGPIDNSAIETLNRTNDLPVIPQELAMKNIPIQLEIVYE